MDFEISGLSVHQHLNRSLRTYNSEANTRPTLAKFRTLLDHANRKTPHTIHSALTDLFWIDPHTMKSLNSTKLLRAPAIWAAVGILFATKALAQMPEDLLQSGLDDLDLRAFAGTQPVNEGVLESARGIKYPLSELSPFLDLFSPDSFEVSEDGTSVQHKQTNETFRIPVFRSVYDNNTVVMVVTDEAGAVSYAEIRDEDKQYDTFFVAGEFFSAANGTVGEDGIDDDVLLSFMAEDIDDDKLENFTLGELPPPMENGNSRFLQHEVGNFGHQAAERLGANGCGTFRAVKLAVVFDSEFCGNFDSADEAVDRIMAIVASASAIYERDLCLQLQLSNIYSPDDSCGGESKTFKNFNRNVLCRGSAFMLDDFGRWMTGKRDSANIDADALVHLFTGSKPSDAIGCAWTGVVSFRLCACCMVKLALMCRFVSHHIVCPLTTPSAALLDPIRIRRGLHVLQQEHRGARNLIRT